MTPEPRYPDRVPHRYAGRPRTAREARADRARRYSSRGPVQSTKSLTAKLGVLGVVATLAIGGLIAAQMASGQDPALGPKAAKKAKKASANDTTSFSSNGASSSTGSSGTDPYTQAYGGDGYYGSSSGYSSGSGYSTQQSAPAPVTSSTS